MKIVNGKQMRDLDKMAIEQFGIPGVILMEHAGLSVVEEVLNSMAHRENKKVIIACGLGNNGGDGFVVARHLFRKGIPVKVFILGNPSLIGGDAKVNYDMLEKLRVDIDLLGGVNNLKKFSNGVRECGLIVDAIFGTGIERELDRFTKDIVQIINESEKEVISIDIPSGISANDGQVYGDAVKADKTVVFQLPKLGNIIYPGTEYGGEIIIKDIGIPKIGIESMNVNMHLITEKMVKNILPTRKKVSYKGSYGKAYLVAGSLGMTGAAILTGKAVLRSGAGLLKIAIPQSLNTIMETGLTEGITVPLPELKRGVIGISDIQKIIKTIEEANVIAIGPGNGRSRELEELIRNVFENVKKPIVLDADALNCLANRRELFELINIPVVMTPHVGEMSRMTQMNIEDIKKNRIEVALEYAKKWKVVLVLKGAKTVVAGPDGQLYINETGNPGMATAGSGDVLTGIITSFIAQGIEPIKAAVAAVYIHGAAGDRAAEKYGEYGLVAGDIVESLPFTIKEIVGK